MSHLQHIAIKRPRSPGLLAVVLGVFGFGSHAAAHPHVWVTSKAEIVYSGGQIAAIQHHWTFDEFYTAMAIQGLDKNNDGIYSREELDELAKVNMEGLKEFDYFTTAQIDKSKLPFAAPQDAWLEHVNGVLTLHFKLPLKTPVAAPGEGFKLAVYDPTYFIAFEYAKGDAITLAGAPSGCHVRMAALEPSDDEKTLTGAMTQQFGASGLGGTTQAADVTCAKS